MSVISLIKYLPYVLKIGNSVKNVPDSINGSKTIIGISIFGIGLLMQIAPEFIPILQSISPQEVGLALEGLGTVVAGIGIWHKKHKEKKAQSEVEQLKEELKKLKEKK